MSNIISRFVAGRPAARQQPRQQIANVADTVSKADFDKLVLTVNTMAKAVEGLIEDFDAVTSPEKLKAVVNAAFKEITPPAGQRQPLALKPEGTFRAPSADGDTMQVNKGHRGRPPLALPADDHSNLHLAPQGE